MRNNYYTIGFVNITKNLVTGIIPIIALFILNYKVYKCLLERRAQVAELGLLFTFQKKTEHFSPIIKMFLVTCAFYSILHISHYLNQFFSATQFASNQFESERKLSNILFGIVALFFCGHVLRTVLNIHRYFIMESHAKVIESHPVGNGSCIVPTPFWIQVLPITHYRIHVRTLDD